MKDTLVALYRTILSRKGADGATSYVAKLFNKGTDHIAKKMGEEAVETAIASARGDRAQIVYESADMLFHWLVLLAAHGITPEEVMDELARREGTSGIEEKKSRKE